jgi:hypothetical protein
MKYKPRPLPGDEPEIDKKDTPLLDQRRDKPQLLLDQRGQPKAERPTRTSEGRIVGDGRVTVQKRSEATAPAFHLRPPRKRSDPGGADWRDTVKQNSCPTGLHATADELSAIRAETYYDVATEARGTGVPIAPVARAPDTSRVTAWIRAGTSPAPYVNDLLSPDRPHRGARVLPDLTVDLEALLDLRDKKKVDAHRRAPPPDPEHYCLEKYLVGQKTFEVSGIPAGAHTKALELFVEGKRAQAENLTDFFATDQEGVSAKTEPSSDNVPRSWDHPSIPPLDKKATMELLWRKLHVKAPWPSREDVSAACIYTAHMEHAREQSLLTPSIHTGPECNGARRIVTDEPRDQRTGEAGYQAKLSSDGRVQFLKNGSPAVGFSRARQIVGKRYPYSTTRTLTFKTKPFRRDSQPIQRAASLCYWERNPWPTHDGAEIFGPFVFSRPSNVGRPKIGDLPLNNSQKSMRKRERAEYREILVPPGISDKAAVSSLAHTLAFFLFHQPTNHEVHHHQAKHRNQAHASPAQ